MSAILHRLTQRLTRGDCSDARSAHSDLNATALGKKFFDGTAINALVAIDRPTPRGAIDSDSADGTDLCTAAAINTTLLIAFGTNAALDADVILLCLETIIRAARHSDLEFMRQLATAVSGVEFLSEGGRVDITRRTDRIALTRGDCSDARSAHSDLNATALGKKFFDGTRLNFCRCSQ